MQRVIEYLFRSILCVVLLLTGWALLRIFVCDQFVVPSESMSPTLIAGDRILANKLVAGARIYKKIEFGKDIPLRSFRMPGLREVRPNDVVIFNARAVTTAVASNSESITYIPNAVSALPATASRSERAIFITIATQHRSETSISSDASTVPPTR